MYIVYIHVCTLYISDFYIMDFKDCVLCEMYTTILCSYEEVTNAWEALVF